MDKMIVYHGSKEKVSEPEIRKTRFTKDNFIDQIDFDYLEIHVIEED